jgi:cell division protein FtsB
LALKQDAALKRVTGVMQAQRQKIAEVQAENAALKVEVEALKTAPATPTDS